MSGARHANFNRALVLSLLMMMMTQVGYLESINPWTNGEETLDETNDVLESGGSGSSFAYANDKMSLGGDHTCAILGNGSMMCWGSDYHGQMGNGAIGDTLANKFVTPILIDLGGGQTAVAVDAGQDHTCAILDDDSLKCWGRDNFGQLGDGGVISTIITRTNIPVSVDLGTGRTAFAVSAGGYHTCAILDDGSMECWGRDSEGQLGNGATTTTDQTSPVSVDLGTGRTAVSVSTGAYHTCAILDDASLKCWGKGQLGAVGDGTGWNNEFSPVLIDVGTGRTAVAVTLGGVSTCVLLDDGSVKCWGGDNNGVLGDGGNALPVTNTNTPPSTPLDLGTGRTAVAISLGAGTHACAILDNGSVKCWGKDTYGQLGNGLSLTADQTSPTSSPVDLGTGRTAVAVAVGGDHTCAILDDASI